MMNVTKTKFELINGSWVEIEFEDLGVKDLTWYANFMSWNKSMRAWGGSERAVTRGKVITHTSVSPCGTWKSVYKMKREG